MSDMATLTVKNREFQRSPASWLHRARQGDTIVIISPDGPPLTLHAGKPKAGHAFNWDEHFEWLKKQQALDANPVDELRKNDKR
jgi:hypothetical protein